MNMFNTEVDVGQSSQSPSLLGQDDGLGDDVYYQQKKTGEIAQIWYEEDDSPYFVNVRMQPFFFSLVAFSFVLISGQNRSHQCLPNVFRLSWPAPNDVGI
jgi:hypothetical protein